MCDTHFCSFYKSFMTTLALFYYVAYGPEKETWDILIKNSNKQSRYVRYAQNRFSFQVFHQDCEDYAVYNRERSFQISAFYTEFN